MRSRRSNCRPKWIAWRRQTRDARVLGELFDALGRDSFVIAETLAREALADRSTQTPDARRGHSAVWTGTELIVWGGGNENVDLNTGGRYNPATDTWSGISTGVNSPTGPHGLHFYMDGYGDDHLGGHGDSGDLNSGSRYNPSTDSWETTSTAIGVPDPRDSHTAVWTGTEMIIWGGFNYPKYLNTGARYDPSTDSWTPTSTGANLPDSRLRHTAVWTGTDMIVWGGYRNEGPGDDVYLNTGGLYNPSLDAWSATSVGADVPAARHATHCRLDRLRDDRLGRLRVARLSSRWRPLRPVGRYLGGDLDGSQRADGSLSSHRGLDRHRDDRLGWRGPLSRGAEQRRPLRPHDRQLGGDFNRHQPTDATRSSYCVVDRHRDDRLGWLRRLPLP